MKVYKSAKIKLANWDNHIEYQGLQLQWVDHGDMVSYQAEFKGKTQMASTSKADFMQRFGEQINAANQANIGKSI